MPWCEECAKYLAPSAMNTDGTCPSCNRTVAAANIHGTITPENLDLKRLAKVGEEDDVSVPWHFRLLVGALIMYLSWRVIDLFR